METALIQLKLSSVVFNAVNIPGIVNQASKQQLYHDRVIAAHLMVVSYFSFGI